MLKGNACSASGLLGQCIVGGNEGTTNRSEAMFPDWCAQEGLTVMDIEIEIPQPANSTGHIWDHVLVPHAQAKYVDHQSRQAT